MQIIPTSNGNGNGNGHDSDEDCKAAFLLAAVLDDHPYSKLSALETFAQVLQKAMITPSMINKPEQREYESFLTRASRNVDSATLFGRGIRKHLDDAATLGIILRDSGLSIEEREKDSVIRDTFLIAAGAADMTHYDELRMGAQETMHTVLETAGINNQMIADRTGIALSTIKRQKGMHSIKAAQQLGETVKPLLQDAVGQKRILAGSYLSNPEWSEHPEKLRKTFYDDSGITRPCAPHTKGVHNILSYYFSILNTNVGLTYQKIGESFLPPVDGHYIYRRLRKNDTKRLAIDSAFVRQFAVAIKPFLEQGATEGWLDSESKKPLPFDEILINRLEKPLDYLNEKTDEEALLYCVAHARQESSIPANTGLPITAIGPMLGQDETWFIDHQKSQPPFCAADVAHIADVIKPYLEGKKWEGVLEVTNPQYLLHHQTARDYVIERLQSRLPEEAAGQVMTALIPMPHTLGPTLSAIRNTAGISQQSFGKNFQSVLSRLEANIFKPHFIEESEDKTNELHGQLDHFIEEIVNRWRDPSKRSTSQPEVPENFVAAQAARRRSNPIQR